MVPSVLEVSRNWLRYYRITIEAEIKNQMCLSEYRAAQDASHDYVMKVQGYDKNAHLWRQEPREVRLWNAMQYPTVP